MRNFKDWLTRLDECNYQLKLKLKLMNWTSQTCTKKIGLQEDDQ